MQIRGLVWRERISGLVPPAWRLIFMLRRRYGFETAGGLFPPVHQGSQAAFCSFEIRTQLGKAIMVAVLRGIGEQFFEAGDLRFCFVDFFFEAGLFILQTAPFFLLGSAFAVLFLPPELFFLLVPGAFAGLGCNALFQLQVCFKAAVVNLQFSVFKLKDAVGQTFKKIAVVGDYDQGARLIFEHAFELFHGRQIEMAGRFIHQEAVAAAQGQAGKGQAAFLSSA